MLKDQS